MGNSLGPAAVGPLCCAQCSDGDMEVQLITIPLKEQFEFDAVPKQELEVPKVEKAEEPKVEKPKVVKPKVEYTPVQPNPVSITITFQKKDGGVHLANFRQRPLGFTYIPHNAKRGGCCSAPKFTGKYEIKTVSEQAQAKHIEPGMIITHIENSPIGVVNDKWEFDDLLQRASMKLPVVAAG
ncbi:unnamed protein product [Polarella glacialis]|uniref:Uncharacterized protein n=1 Tax=Polarella glacialis TaxID=89957 RepID=A0A813F0M0_POLGL|nr:unnamed protein product [Polarella glacialis]